MESCVTTYTFYDREYDPEYRGPCTFSPRCLERPPSPSRREYSGCAERSWFALGISLNRAANVGLSLSRRSTCCLCMEIGDILGFAGSECTGVWRRGLFWDCRSNQLSSSAWVSRCCFLSFDISFIFPRLPTPSGTCISQRLFCSSQSRRRRFGFGNAPEAMVE